ncbi:DUF4097 family beta strand repeat-containing protein [Bdellovibrio sp. BCCA]|uniref:DUF4097 family beta strand repeat-containing protein n=1 Tax=Bdellovibrio sp. BCCA TaxID=3136281 RepID=UPI0030F0BB2C
MNLFTKFFIAFSVWTVAFLSLATYAGGKAFETDPHLVSKLEDKMNVSIRVGGVSKRFHSDSEMVNTQDTWNFAPPAEKMKIKLFTGNVSIKKSSGSEIKITATGDIDKSRAPRLLEAETTGNELKISEPEGDVVKKLDVHIEVPASFAQELDVVTVSGNVTVENLNVDELELKTVSGDIALNQVSANKIEMKSVSGNLNAEGASIKKIEGKSVSGNLAFANSLPADIDLTSVSGDVKMKLVKNDKTQFALKSVSGDIKNAHGSNKNGNYNVKVSTTSGDIEIE